MEGNSNNARIRKEVTASPLTVSRVYAAPFQKEDTLTAELKQTVNTLTFYPTKSVTSNLKDNPFGMSDFGFAEGEPYSNDEVRVTWIDVPIDSTVESVTARLAEMPNANLYRILANKPILSDNQEYAIKSGVTNMDAIANSQVVRYPAGAKDAGKIVKDFNGNVQYRVTNFKINGEKDQDFRSTDAEIYQSEAIKRELGVSAPTEVATTFTSAL